MRTIENRAEDAVLNGLNVFLGIVLFLAPWYLEWGGETAAARNALISGIAIAAVAMFALGKSYAGRSISTSPWVSGWPGRPGRSGSWMPDTPWVRTW